MTDQPFFEDEALIAFLQIATTRLGIDNNRADAIGLAMRDGAAAELNSALVELCQGLPPSAVTIIEDVPPSARLRGALDMRIGTNRGPDGKPTKMRFFRVKDASYAVGISLVGLSVSLMMKSPAAIVPGANGLKALYDNVIKLESPHDDAAMQTYDALLRCAIERATESRLIDSESPAALPRATDLHSFNGPEPAVTTTALKRLKDLGLAEVVHWGGAGGDFEHPENRWSHCV